jgi:hypothetical protein
MHGLELLTSTAANGARLLADPELHSVAVWSLAGTLLWSGSSKLRRPWLAATALLQFGLVKTVSRRSGQALGFVELSLAAILLAGLTPLFGLATATALFVAFAVLIAKQLRAGDTRPCYCFGSDAPLTVTALARAVVLAAAAFALGAAAPVWGTPPALDSIGWDAAGAAAIIGLIVLLAAIPTVLRLTSEGGT